MIFVKCQDCIIDMDDCWGVKIAEVENDLTDSLEYAVVAHFKFSQDSVLLGRFKEKEEAQHVINDIFSQIMNFYGFL